LERIFIENKIYRDIEEMTTKETVIKAVDDGLKPYKTLKTCCYRRRYSAFVGHSNHAYFKFDSNKAQDKIEALEGIEQVKHNLEHLIDFAIAYFTKLKYGKDANAKRSYEFY
jgi:topoisomerase-4 subunit A